MTWRTSLLLLVIAAGIIAAFVADPVPQDPAYHDFADERGFLGVPNFLDVFSNLAFAVVGIVALKLFFGLLGIAVSLLMSLLWLAAIGFLFYLAVKIISPETARRIREKIQGQSISDVSE